MNINNIVKTVSNKQTQKLYVREFHNTKLYVLNETA
jgi:hypothetical protein